MLWPKRTEAKPTLSRSPEGVRRCRMAAPEGLFPHRLCKPTLRRCLGEARTAASCYCRRTKNQNFHGGQSGPLFSLQTPLNRLLVVGGRTRARVARHGTLPLPRGPRDSPLRPEEAPPTWAQGLDLGVCGGTTHRVKRSSETETHPWQFQADEWGHLSSPLPYHTRARHFSELLDELAE